MKNFSLSPQVRKQPTRLVLLGWVVLTILVALTQTAFAYQDPTTPSSGTKDNKPIQTAFSYQGQLKEGSVPANGTYNFQFALYTGQGGGQKLAVVIKDDVVVTNGSFTVQLDFGNDGFSSNESWLEVAVRPASSADSYTALSPRQRLTPTPYAILAQAEPWSLIGVPVGFPRGTDADLVPGTIADHSVTSEKIADGQVVKSINSVKDNVTLAAGNNVTITPSGNTLTIASQDSSVWVKDGTTARLSTSTDKVGIGTTRPIAKLDVAGDIHASDAVTVGNSVGLLSSPVVNLIEVDSPNPNPLLAIGFSNPFSTTPPPGPFSTIKVGVGTLSPTATLHINGTTRFSGIATLDNSASVQLRAAANGGARILGQAGNTPAKPAIGFFFTNGVDDISGGNGIFRPAPNTMAFATSSTERMRINSGGNVGIGTATPAALFSVGNSNQFRVSPAGDLIRIKNVMYSWPTSNAVGVLTNNGAGVLTWAPSAGGGVTGNCSAGANFVTKWLTGSAVTCSQIFEDNLARVGIGTTTPTQKLTLGLGNILLPNANSGADGNLYFGGITDSGQVGMRLFGGLVNTSTPGGFIDVMVNPANPSDGLRFRVDTNSGGIERMRITASGNVGIGTGAPVSKLDVSGGGNAILHVHGATIPSVPVEGAYIGWNALNAATGETDFINNRGLGTGGFAFMQVPPSGSPITTHMFLDGSGKLGIGTTSPTNTLDVNGQARIRVLTPSLSNDVVVADPITHVLSTRPASSLGGGGTPGGTNGSVQFNNSGAFGGDATNFFWDNTNKRLGINTNNQAPENALEVRGNVSLIAGPTGRVFLANAPASATFFNDNSPKLSFFGTYGGIVGPSIQKIYEGSGFGRGRLAFFQHGAPDFATETEVMTIASNGNVGIGTITPQNTLDVIGGIRVTSMPIGPTTPTVCWDATNNLVKCNTSDARLKTDVTQLTNVLEKLEGIRGVSFEWNKLAKSLGNFSERREIGVIAQEVEAVFPEVVITSNSDGYKSVDYSKLTAVLIEAVKELKAENAALKQRLEALEKAVPKR